MRGFQEAKRFGANFSGGMAAGAESCEIRAALLIEDGFGHDAAGGIAGAEEENVVVVRH